MPPKTTEVPLSVPLSVLLSQALVAYTIEFDNEFERRVPHRTAMRAGRGPWLTSMVMWSNFVRLIPPDGIPYDQVKPYVPLVNLGGLTRWGYVAVDDDVVTLKPGGRLAAREWRPLAAEIDERWRSRHGDALFAALPGDDTLPLGLPVVGYADGMRADHAEGAPGAPATDLGALLSQALLGFIREYERHTRLSLPMQANVIRTLSRDGVRVRDLPARSGVSKEGIAAALGWLERRALATVASVGGARVATLTAKGADAQASHGKVVDAIEARWPGAPTIRDALPTAGRLADGLAPPPDGWRAARPYLPQTRAVLADPASALPHCPMVLHRGGYPDGS